MKYCHRQLADIIQVFCKTISKIKIPIVVSVKFYTINTDGK